MTPKEKRDPTYCSRHREYKGRRRPRTGCTRCLTKFNQAHGAPPPQPPATPPSIPVIGRGGPGLVNRIAIVLDRSSSMSHLREPVVRAFNQTLEELRRVSRESGQLTELMLVTFADNVRVDVSPRDVQGFMPIGLSDYDPYGNTALFAGVSEAIRHLAGVYSPPGIDPSFLVITITDGEENASERIRGGLSVRRIQEEIARLQGTDRWTFAFQVPPGGKARRELERFGVPSGNIQEWEATERGVAAAASTTRSSVGTYYNSRAAGARSVRTFYSPDASKLTPDELRRDFQDISSLVSIWKAERETTAKDLCEKKTGQPMLKGALFYQLMKDEKEVQDYKKILLVEKGKPHVWFADPRIVRQRLGLPLDGTVAIRPGNHANLDIYVQSTSYGNRVLPRGTTAIHWSGVGQPMTQSPSTPRPIPTL